MTKQYFQTILFLLFCHVLPLTVTAQVVDIPDLNLRAAFEHALGKASGAIITTADMENLTSLEAQGVHDLTGLESATNLTRLLINGNVSDLSPLAGLTQLNRLQLLNASNLSDLSSLAGLTQLNHLEVSGSRNVSDLSPLAGLTQLNHLNLFGANNVSDLSPFGGFNAAESPESLLHLCIGPVPFGGFNAAETPAAFSHLCIGPVPFGGFNAAESPGS